jgi:hypothetical protein
VGVQVYRELDGWGEAGELVRLLLEFDAFIVDAAGPRSLAGTQQLETAAAEGDASWIRMLLDEGAV